MFDFWEAFDMYLSQLYWGEGLLIAALSITIYFLEKTKKLTQLFASLFMGFVLISMSVDSFGHYKYYTLFTTSTCYTGFLVYKLYKAVRSRLKGREPLSN